MKILNQNSTRNIKYETSSIEYSEENTWEFIESLQYKQSKYADTISTFNLTLIVLIFFILLIFVIGIFKRNIMKNDIIKKVEI